MHLSRHVSPGASGSGGSFILLLAFALAVTQTVTTAALRDGNLSPAGNAPNIVPPPTGNGDDDNVAPRAATAASQPLRQANPVCDSTVTCTLFDTQSPATQLMTAGTQQCCTSTGGDCGVVRLANSVSANLCGPPGHSQLCTDCAKLGVAMNDLNIDCQKDYQVGGKVAIPYLDGVTLELQPGSSA